MRKIVLGIGNIIQRDEGLGVHALHQLEEQLAGMKVDPELELLDGGVLGLDLLPMVEECSHLLVLDAINGSQPPGTLVELSKDAIPLYIGIKMSQHQVTFQEVLGLAMLRGYLPEHLHLVGAQPVDISTAIEPTPEIKAQLPAIVAQAVLTLRKWGLVS